MNEDLKLVLADEERPQRIDPLDTIVAPLMRSRILIGACALAGILVGVFMGITRPNEYESIGKLLVRSGAREEATPETTISESRTATTGNRDAVNNEIHLLSSPIVYELAAKKVGPAAILASYQPRANPEDGVAPHTAILHAFQRWWFGSGGVPEDADAETQLRMAKKVLMDGIVLEAEPFSSIMVVRYATHSQVLARDVVEAYLEAAEVHHRDVFASESALSFLEEQIETLSLQTIQADQDLANFRAECSIWDLDSQRDSYLKEMEDTRLEIAAARRRLRELEENIPLIEELLAGVDRSVELTETGGVKGVASGQRTTQLNPIYVSLTDDLVQAKLEQRNLTTSQVSLEDRLAQLRNDLVGLEQCAPQQLLLEMTAEKRKRTLSQYSDSYDRAQSLNLLDQVGMSNLRTIQPATFPIDKKGPKRSKLVILGAIMGLAFGLALAFVRRLFDHRLYSAYDVRNALDVPLLAVVEENRDWLPAQSLFRVLPGEHGAVPAHHATADRDKTSQSDSQSLSNPKVS